jgi:hypothetical protein
MQEDEERAESSWEKRVAFVLCNHEKGSLSLKLYRNASRVIP